MQLKNNKVLILTAGTGRRMGVFGDLINKALLPLDAKAIISHIIEKFPSQSEFVIALGYKSEQVRAYLKLAHPNLKFTYVEVENFDGPGSGPGLSSLTCKAYLTEPFYFVSCDTLWSEDITALPNEKSWVAGAQISREDSDQYCNIILKDGAVAELIDKQKITEKDFFAFSGLAYIKEAALFWAGLENSELIRNEQQVSGGFQKLAAQNLLGFEKVNWTDLGTFEKYVAASKKYEKYDFTKTDEFVYLLPDRVIKFFKEADISRQRVLKAGLNSDVFPRISGSENQFYSYSFVPGMTLYKEASPETFSKLLSWLDEKLWIEKNAPPEQMRNLCEKFYLQKTKQRLNLYDAKYPQASQPSYINNERIPSAASLLAQLSLEDMTEFRSYFIHGDLQPDNIIYDSNAGSFCLLDWRQDFAGETEFGDLYYDFAKLRGGLNLNYDQIKQNKFSYSETGDHATLSYPQHAFSTECNSLLETYLNERKHDLRKINILTGLIYLNMSPLHHAPFDQLLHALGRKILNETLNPKILLAIPAYNCESQIQRVIAGLASLSFLRERIHKIIIFDNRSTDDTFSRAEEAARRHNLADLIEVVKNATNVGLGGTQKIAFRKAVELKYSHIVILHGDDQANCSDLKQVLEHISCGYEAVLGARFMNASVLSGYSYERRLGNRVLNFIYSAVTGKQVYDLGSGLNAFKVSSLSRLNTDSYSNKFTFNMDLLLDLFQNNFRYKYLPIEWRETDQVSNARNFSVAWKAFKILIHWKLKLIFNGK